MKKSSIHRQIRAIGPALLLGCASVTALAQDLGHKSPPQSKPVIIHNATIHPVSGPAIDGGFVAFDAGKITAVGKPDSAFDLGKRKSDGWLIIDAAGKHVYPGLIAAYTQLGLTEVAAARATLDMSEVGQATPEVRASVAVNPDSTLIPVARTNGVLIAGVFPSAALTGQNAALDGPGGIVPGRAGVMLLDGWTTEQMAADPQAGIIVNWPSMRPVTAWWMNLSKQEQRKDSETTLAIIDKLFADARAYSEAKSGEGGGEPPSPPISALRPCSRRSMPPGHRSPSSSSPTTTTRSFPPSPSASATS